MPLLRGVDETQYDGPNRVIGRNTANLQDLAVVTYRADIPILREGRNALPVSDILPSQRNIAGPAFLHLAKAVTEGQRTARFKPAPKVEVVEDAAPTAPVRRRRRTAAQIAVDNIMAEQERIRVNLDFETEPEEEAF